MRTVNIAEFEHQLTHYLQDVKNGEEIVISDDSVPVARILPFRPVSAWSPEAAMVAAGALKMPEEEMDWNKFFALPAGNISQKAAIQAVIDSRGER